MNIVNEERFIGVLLVGCIGDILGSTNEGKSFSDIRLSKIITGFVTNKYTDDTELTLTLAQYLLKLYGSSHIVHEEIHRMYKNVVSTSTRGYSLRTRHVLTNWDECTIGGSADTNGCVMRIAPLAYVDFAHNLSDDVLLSLVKNSIYCTHGENQNAVDVSFIHVKAISCILKDKHCKTPLDLYNYILHYCRKRKNVDLYSLLLLINPYNAPVLFKNKTSITTNDNVTKNIFGHDLFQIKATHLYVCALVCFLYNFNNPVDALIVAANFGGDTDTICKVVGDFVGAKHGTKWIPSEWSQPENFEEINRIGKELYRKFTI